MNDNFEASLKAWNENEKAANELINIVGRLWYDKSVELILLRSLLVNRGSGKILASSSKRCASSGFTAT